MTTWSDLDPATGVDEFDPLRAMTTQTEEPESFDSQASASTSGTGPVPRVEDERIEAPEGSQLDENGEFDLSRHLIDPSGTVRIWVDEDLNLTKCRVSPKWRDKLRVRGVRASENDPLVGAFSWVFLVAANVRRPQPVVTDDRDVSLEPSGMISYDAIYAIMDRSAELTRRWDELGEDEGFGHVEGDPAVGTGGGGKVAVWLTLDGDFSRVEFDQEWLNGSRVGMINDAIVEAAAQARQRFVPGVYVPGERDEIVKARTRIESELSALARKGFQ